MKPTKTYVWARIFAFALSSLAWAGTPVLAQLTPQPAPTQPQPARAAEPELDTQEEIIELSPFVVEAATGSYVANSTLAGTRLRTDIADVGASLSILTDQLMSDIGGTDAGSVLSVVPNIEVAGRLGNYSAQDFTGSGNTAYIDANSSRTGLSSPQRVRGLVSAELTRNYFQTGIPFDTYNTSQVTVARGPNSVLFGLGSPGGIIENSMKMPTRQNSNQVSLRFSHYGGHRETLDINRSLAGDRIAFRIAAMNEKEKYRQKEAFEDDQRLYASWDIKLHQARSDAMFGQTTLRGYYETGKLDRNPPDIIPPTQNYRWWHDVSAYKQLVGNYPGINSVTDISNLYKTVAEGGAWIPNDTVSNGTPTISTQVFTPNITPIFITGVFVHDNPRSAPGVGGFDAMMPRLRFPGTRSTQDVRLTGSHYNLLPGFSNSTYLNRNTFDFVKHLYAGDTSTITDDFDVYEFTLDQQLFKGAVGFEVTGNKQAINGYRYTPYNTGSSRAISIDISEALPIPATVPSSGNNPPMLANPHLGRPVISAQGYNQSWTRNTRDTVRATGYAKHNFADSLGDQVGKWLGKHTVSALWQESSNRNRNYNEQLNWQSDLVDFSSQAIFGQGFNDGRRSVNSFLYVGPSALGTTSADQVIVDQFPLTRATLPVPGKRVSFTYWDNVTKQVLATTAYPLWVPQQGSNINEQQVDSNAFILQSNTLDDHLVTIFAVRDDAVRNYEMDTVDETASTPIQLRRRLPNGAFNTAIHRLRSTPSFEDSDKTYTKSFVLKFPEKYLFNLPFNSDFRVHYFESDTFQPVGLGRNLNNEILDNPTGKTEEYGFSFDILDRRLSLSATWYETSSIGARNNTGLAQINAWIGVASNNWLSRASQWELAGNPVTTIPGALAAGYTDYATYYAAIQNLAPEPYRSATGVVFDRASGTIRGTGIEGLNSSFDFVSEGMEIELAGSITKNWNVVFNVAQQETVQSNTLPGVLAFAKQVQQNIINAGLSNVSDSPTLNEGPGAVFLNRWNNAVMSPILAEVAKDGQKSEEQREWRWNLISSYRFDQGFLRGTTIGGVARWQDKSAIGYAYQYNADLIRIPDLSRPYYGPTEFNADFFISYRRKLGKNINWVIQFNVRNAIGGDEDELIPISIDPVGNVDAVRTSPEREFLLTNTFNF
jgi:hypothetical protein